MKRGVIVTAVLLAGLAGNAHADFIGLYVGAGIWSHSPSGDFNSTQSGSDTLDLEDTLDAGSETDGYFYAAFEHFVPFVPNVRVESTSLSHSGDVGSVSFDGGSQSGNAEVNLDHQDLLLYYSPLDNWINLDFGVDVRSMDAEFKVGDGSNTVSKTMPLLFLGAQFDLPLTGLSAGIDYRTGGLDGVSWNDTKIRGVYEFGIAGVELGYQTKSFELDDVSHTDASMDFKGLYVGGFLHF